MKKISLLDSYAALTFLKQEPNFEVVKDSFGVPEEAMPLPFLVKYLFPFFVHVDLKIFR